ncbi:hypothetical protein [Brucella intermedia]|uniref:hypothetical protein n=1 Tax=Brucella intermedia TaxID=94625 RepID=UPI000C294BA7|nr:hypothetical protein [Brucella intermedia]PJR89996.1 hypothetical protein CN881_12440 [Ochrobactrum sp. 721/2009]PJT14213.1 hypothetical protein CN880_21470 [Ochrobactrum sp. 720/2009]PJT24382.1 hypothetical protein CN879_08500 [Ochrobactrum sp. 715/2009]PJT30293.1 hypothetical protein CN878_02575 [Ochrobactrum sp. 695/2009]PJT33820.1 hypothetical protein CN877_09470 [Ochrobactrum sp. 689/2009]
MADTRFTPGPWDFEPSGKEAGYIGFPDGSGFYAAIREGDGHLIAAATDLYEASEPFDDLATLRDVNSPEWCDSDTLTVVVSIRSLRAIKAARAKAEGRS